MKNNFSSLTRILKEMEAAIQKDVRKRITVKPEDCVCIQNSGEMGENGPGLVVAQYDGVIVVGCEYRRTCGNPIITAFTCQL